MIHIAEYKSSNSCDTKLIIIPLFLRNMAGSNLASFLKYKRFIISDQCADEFNMRHWKLYNLVEEYSKSLAKLHVTSNLVKNND
jgi:hypothetical protein